MRYRYLLLVILTTVLFACKKSKETGIPTAPSPPVVIVPGGLLRDITLSHLPSPFYHFEYNAAGKVTFVSYASDFLRYDVQYDGDRITEMRNNIIVNKDRLQYFYDAEGRVNVVRYADSTGLVYKRINLTYDGPKLIKFEREVKLGGVFIVDKTLTMTYHDDGNLLELTQHRPPLQGQNEFTFTDRYEQYDNKINIEGVGLLHDEFFDHFVFLPAVQLQKNNPGKVTRTGDGINFKVDYTYIYNALGAPLTRSGDFIYTNGANTGQRIPLSSTYTYY